MRITLISFHVEHSPQTSHSFIEKILNEHGMECYRAFCLVKTCVLNLCDELTQKYGLHSTMAKSI